VLAQEGRDLDVVFVGDLSPLCVELADSPFRGSGTRQIPGVSGLDGTARCSILGGRVVGFILPRGLLGTEAEADIGGQALEQSAGIPGLGVMSFFGLK
jgi:hypothetical protein